MDHRPFVVVIVVSCIGILLSLPGALEEMLTFLFIGKIPLTNVTLPLGVMLCIDGALLVLSVYTLIRLSITAAREEAMHGVVVSTPPAKTTTTKNTRTTKKTTKTTAQRRTQKRSRPATAHSH